MTSAYPRASGAFEFRLQPGSETRVDVRARLWLRGPVATLGLAPLITRAIYEQLRVIVASTGTAMLVVEQNAHLALHYCDEAYVLERGQIALSGTARELASNEQVLKAYLGLTADA